MVPGISEKSGGVTSTILSDRMGSMKGLSNAGTVTDTAEFDAFGKVVSRTGTNATQKGFVGGAGYQEDGESGYKLLGHRYYDADTGRFLSRDPAFAGRNWYGYCENKPLKYCDPEGFDLTIIGQNSGIEEWDWAAEHLFGSGGKTLRQPTKAELLEALINQEDGATIVLWGHGGSGFFNVNDKESLRESDIRYVQAERARRGKGKLGRVYIRGCCTCTDMGWLNAWLELSNDVYGYTVSTIDGPLQHWNSPVIRNPAPNSWWPWDTGEGKKKGKGKGAKGKGGKGKGPKNSAGSS